MRNRIYALLVGINDYPAHVGRLYGCVNDVKRVHDHLFEHYDNDLLRVEVLVDSDATRQNIIDQFRNHLCNARPDDVVLFHYSGHGARCASAEEFAPFYPDRRDEGLVCFDSRNDGGFDLADKELAVLLAEVADNDPHIAVVLDCCHSGSGTRSDDFTHLAARQTHEISAERPLESYLDGFYKERLALDESLTIPTSQHILLAACRRVQKAWEGKDRSGVFTSALLNVLEQANDEISYASLFQRCRREVRKAADDQDPQFETYRGFNAYNGFLGRQAALTGRRHTVFFSDDVWKLDAGAIHGLPTEPEQPVELAVYTKTEASAALGRAATTQVGAQKSVLELQGFEADPTEQYEAEVTSLPMPPLAVKLTGDSAGIEFLQNSLVELSDETDRFILLTDDETKADFTLTAEDDAFYLKWSDTEQLIQGAKGYSDYSAHFIFRALQQIGTRQRAIALQNDSTAMNTELVEFKMYEVDEQDCEHELPSNEPTFDIEQEDGEWRQVAATLKATNRSNQPLYMMLVHFADDFGIDVLYNERIEPTDSEFIVTPGGLSVFGLGLEESEGNQASHHFKLIVSTEKVDDFLLQQDKMKLGFIYDPSAERLPKGLTLGHPRKKRKHENEWFTKDIHISLIRRQGKIATTDVTFANGNIKIKGHSSLRASVSMSGAKCSSRNVGAGENIHRYLERQGMELLNFAGTRGDEVSVLELTDIENAGSIEDNPLELELDVPLAEGEAILPLTFDGEHLIMTGVASQNDDGKTQIQIDSIPDIPDRQRSLRRSLKLYFFKTYLHRTDTSQLGWIEFNADGSFERHLDGLNEQIETSQNILLLVHGLMGNTDTLVKGLVESQQIAEFDLVLTYDYENMNTPLSLTAIELKKQLADVGISADDEIQITIVAHSTGGLIGRWLIEREGGNQFIDHLVMFGTPNNGSPFGRVKAVRSIMSVLTTVAINLFPGVAPFGVLLLAALMRSANLTVTLEQAAAGSEFMTSLNTSDDPQTRYTIIAGDVNAIETKSNLSSKLTAKLCNQPIFSKIFKDSPHDIAVSQDSSFEIPGNRSPGPETLAIACHHLNYFAESVGVDALATALRTRK